MRVVLFLKGNLVAHSVAVSNKCGEMLAVEVHQVVFELLVQKSLTALLHHLLWRWSQVVLVVVDPDTSSWRNFDLRNALRADSGLPQNTITVRLWNHLLKEAAAGSLCHVLISHSKMDNTAISNINSPKRQS